MCQAVGAMCPPKVEMKPVPLIGASGKLPEFKSALLSQNAISTFTEPFVQNARLAGSSVFSGSCRVTRGLQVSYQAVRHGSVILRFWLIESLPLSKGT